MEESGVWAQGPRIRTHRLKQGFVKTEKNPPQNVSSSEAALGVKNSTPFLMTPQKILRLKLPLSGSPSTVPQDNPVGPPKEKPHPLPL